MKIDVDARARLKALVKEVGTQKAAAEKLGVTGAQVGELLHGTRGFSDAMLAKLGLRYTVIEATQ